MSNGPNLQIITLPEVLEKVRASKTSIYRWMAAGLFPKQIKYGHSAIGWIESEIDDWIKERMEARDAA